MDLDGGFSPTGRVGVVKYKDFTEASPSLASDQRQPHDGSQPRWRVSRLPHPQAAAASGCSAVPSGPSRGPVKSATEVSHQSSLLSGLGLPAPLPPTHPAAAVTIPSRGG